LGGGETHLRGCEGPHFSTSHVHGKKIADGRRCRSRRRRHETRRGNGTGPLLLDSRGPGRRRGRRRSGNVNKWLRHRKTEAFFGKGFRSQRTRSKKRSLSSIIKRIRSHFFRSKFIGQKKEGRDPEKRNSGCRGRFHYPSGKGVEERGRRRPLTAPRTYRGVKEEQKNKRNPEGPRAMHRKSIAQLDNPPPMLW